MAATATAYTLPAAPGRSWSRSHARLTFQDWGLTGSALNRAVSRLSKLGPARHAMEA